MVHGAVKGLFQSLILLLAGLLALVALMAWRLSDGPLALDFLTPSLEAALNAQAQGLNIRLGSTVLALGQGQGRSLVEVRVVDVKATAPENDQPLAVVPEMALTLNGRALMNGVIAPNAFRLYRPRLHLVRGQDGRLQMDLGPEDANAPDAAQVTQGLIAAVVGEPDPNHPGRYLQRVSLVDAELAFEDQVSGTLWRAPGLNVELKRTDTGAHAEISMWLDMAGQTGSFVAHADYGRLGDTLTGEIAVNGIRPARFSLLGGILAPLKGVDLPLGGMVRAAGSLNSGLDWAEINVTGGAGDVHLDHPQALTQAIAGLTLRAKLSQAMQRLDLDELGLDLGNTQGGTKISLKGQADGLKGDVTLGLDAHVANVAVDDLPRLWPAFVATNARDWVVANMSKGMVRATNAHLQARIPNGNPDLLQIIKLQGDMVGDGVTVDYLRPMPPVHNAKAQVTFDASDFRIGVKGGELWGLRLVDGMIVLSGLDKEDQFADIDLSINGPVHDALKLIDNKPLRYAQALGVDPEQAGGEAKSRLKLKFPLLKNLRLDDVQVKVRAQTKGVSLPKVLLGQDLSQADLDLDVDAKGLDAVGPIRLGPVAGELKWRENFSRNAPFRSRYQVSNARIDDAGRRAFGLDGIPFQPPYLSGTAIAQVVATLYGGGNGDIEIKADLSPARMSLPGFGWRKQERTTAGADLSIKLQSLKLAAIPRFHVMAGDLATQGAVSFEDGKIRRVDFTRLTYGGRTDISGSLTFHPDGGLAVQMKGEQFDAEPFLATEDPPPDRSKPRKKPDLPPMAIEARLAKLWVSKPGSLSNALVRMRHDGSDWRQMNIKAALDGDKAFSLNLDQAGPNRRTVKVTSDDAGQVLKAFDSFEHMSQGRLEVEAAYDDSKNNQPLSGTIRISDYYVSNAPVLARLLSVAALTGVVDLLRGEGIGFSNLDAPFVLADGLLQVSDARAYGSALGLTGKGEIDLERSRMALEGSVVPAYAVNSMLGKIPVLGWLVTGGEKGGGLVAFNYQIRGNTADPDVIVNPLSALTPGFLRNLFNIFDDGSETEARPREKTGR